MERIKKNFYWVVLGLIFVLALVLRVKTYLFGRILWHDETALAMSVLTRNIFGFFQPLEAEQKAPVIFMLLSKMVSGFGINEICLKFIPFISGLASVAVFYFLSKRIFKSKFAIIAANFLFAINYQLIYWAQKFKQYSFDVFLFMLSVLLFSKLDLNKISYKKCLLFSFLSALLILSSFPCAFAVGGFVLFCIFSRANFKKVFVYVLPLIMASLIYYFKVLYKMQSHEVSSYLSYWNTGFLKFSLGSLLLVFKENFVFFFIPNKFVLIGLLLFVTGALILLKERTKTSNIILLSFLGTFLASMLKIYPIYQRTALYLLPIALLFMVKPLDLVSKGKKVKSFVIVLLLFVCFCMYNSSYINSFFKQNIFLKTDGLATFPTLVKKFDNKNDILVINSTTKSDFIYYSTIYRFRPQKVVLLPVYRYDQDYYYQLLNSLPKGHDYWFIYGWEYSHRKDDLQNNILHHLQAYIQDKHLKVLEVYEDNNSVLLKVRF